MRSWVSLRSLVATLVVLAAMTAAAWAISERPNALDRAIDAIPAASLLSQPAEGLIDRARAAAGDRLATLMFPGWATSIGVQILALAYFWQSGSAARLRDALRRRFRSPFALRFAFGAAIGLLARVVALIPEFYIYRVGRTMGIQEQLARSWASDWIVNTAITMLVAGLVVAVILWLVDRTHQWYIYTMLAIVAASVLVTFVTPFLVLPRFGYYEPLPAPYSTDAIALENRTNVHVPILVHVDDRSLQGGAYVTGVGPSARIIVRDSQLRASSRAETEYVVARELAYIAQGGPWRIAFDDALFAILGLALGVAIADRIGFRRDDDPLARVALVAALLGVMYVAVIPFDNGVLRRMTLENERFALGLTHDRGAAVRSIVRETEERLTPVCQRGPYRIFLGLLEDPARRIEVANNVRTSCR